MITLTEYLTKGDTEIGKYTWKECVLKMADWYMDNVKTFIGDNAQINHDNKYHYKSNHSHYGGKYYFCDMFNGYAKDDCIGFVISCLKLFGLFKRMNNTSLKDLGTYDVVCDLMDKGNIYKDLVNNGFEVIEYDKTNELKKYDIIIGCLNAENRDNSKSVKNGYKIQTNNSVTDYDKRTKEVIDNCKSSNTNSMSPTNPKQLTKAEKDKILEETSHHCEIYAGNNLAWGWGQLYDKSDKEHTLPVKMSNRKYNYIIRYTGND